MDEKNQALNDAIRALAGRPVQREEPPVVDGVTRFAAGTGDGGKRGGPFPVAPSNDSINRAFRKAADRVRGTGRWEEVY